MQTTAHEAPYVKQSYLPRWAEQEGISVIISTHYWAPRGFGAWWLIRRLAGVGWDEWAAKSPVILAPVSSLILFVPAPTARQRQPRAPAVPRDGGFALFLALSLSVQASDVPEPSLVASLLGHSLASVDRRPFVIYGHPDEIGWAASGSSSPPPKPGGMIDLLVRRTGGGTAGETYY